MNNVAKQNKIVRQVLTDDRTTTTNVVTEIVEINLLS